MKFVSYSKLAGVPNLVVDGAPQQDTVLTLSHWPRSTSPAEFRADTSTEMVLNYLANPAAEKKYAPKVRAVSNNHFDEDGLCAVWAMLNPKEALALRDLLTDVASAGDFGVYRRPQAAKVAFIIRSYADPVHSPVASKLQGNDEACGSCYLALLPLLDAFLHETDRYGPYWDAEWTAMLKSKTALVTEQVHIREFPSVDLAVVEAPEAVHRMVLHNNTQCMRVLTGQANGLIEMRYRYETWVQYASRKLKPRIDLSPLLPRLQSLEQAPVRWTFDGIAEMTPALRPVDAEGTPAASSLKLDRVAAEIGAFFQKWQDNADMQWNPYETNDDKTAVPDR